MSFVHLNKVHKTQ